MVTKPSSAAPTKRKRGRPHQLHPNHAIVLFIDFWRLLRANPKMKITGAHQELAAKYGVGEKTVRNVIAEYESWLAGTNPAIAERLQLAEADRAAFSEKLRRIVRAEVVVGDPTLDRRVKKIQERGR
jgi:hypothetical protein